MTNQECNQVYWELPVHYRMALDRLIETSSQLDLHAAAKVLVDLSVGVARPITKAEAMEWGRWRRNILAGQKILTP